jgi:hypothetical protein
MVKKRIWKTVTEEDRMNRYGNNRQQQQHDKPIQAKPTREQMNLIKQLDEQPS